MSVTSSDLVKAAPSFSHVNTGDVGMERTEQLKVAALPTTTFLNVGLFSNSENEQISQVFENAIYS